MNIVSYLESRGYQPQKAGRLFRMCCPLHDERSPSFTIYPHDGHFFCYGCYTGGDLVELVKRVEFGSLPDKEGYRRAFEVIGTQPPLLKQERFLERRKFVLSEEQKLVLDWITHQYHEELLKNERAMKYLESRHVGEQVVRDFRLGWCSGHEPEMVITRCGSQLGMDYVESLFDLGILVRPEERERRDMIYERMRGRIVIPERRNLSDHQWVVWIQGRTLDNSNPRKYMFLPLPKVYFGLDRVRSSPRIILVEGVFDALPLITAGQPCIAVLGAQLKKESIEFFRGKKVTICFDNDEVKRDGSRPGADGVVTIREQLQGVADVRVVFPPPGCKDPSEWISTWGIDDVVERLAA